jgi:galactose mutarotase-like enzyme
MLHLKFGDLSVGICRKGAELRSLKHATTGIEYIWQANPDFWGKHSPVLFPIVGSLKNDKYFFDGETYALPRHGFARDKVFDAHQINDTEVVFTLEEDEVTLKAYPFTFRLQLKYRLDENGLSCTYLVHNPSETTLWFSVGGHPAFNVPLTPDTTYDDYYLVFNEVEPLKRWHLQDGLISNETSVLETTNGTLNLRPSLFYSDAIVLKNLKSTQVSLGCHKHVHGVHFDFSGFPYLGIWAAKDAPFICIEPWCGHADTVGHNQQLTEKPGIEMLRAGEYWERKWSVEVF